MGIFLRRRFMAVLCGLDSVFVCGSVVSRVHEGLLHVSLAAPRGSNSLSVVSWADWMLRGGK
jgi:hypothetical protein